MYNECIINQIIGEYLKWNSLCGRFQCGKSSVQECDVHGLGCWWARKAKALVEALLQWHKWIGKNNHNFFFPVFKVVFDLTSQIV